jgi:hypothetical protein
VTNGAADFYRFAHDGRAQAAHGEFARAAKCLRC